jgi:isopenicillin-N N-acyltransferase-like protein
VTREFRSSETLPRRRGEEFGETYRAEIARTIAGYDAVFATRLSDAAEVANRVAASTLGEIERFAQPLNEELRGMAAGSGQPVERLAAINARTEVLAALGLHSRGECSTVVFLGDDLDEPVALQNWDWFAGMSENWLVWTIPHEDGRVTTTLTEYGILGKIGINSAGVGVLFNILHHRLDGARSNGVPVHVLARQVLDGATDANAALVTIANAPVTASTAITVVAGSDAGKTAITAEVWPDGPCFVLPNADGLLLHTNHFLATAAQSGDREPLDAPDTLIRYEVLQRSLHPQRDKITAAHVRTVLTSHVGGTGAICCHPAPDGSPEEQYATLATVQLDFDARTVVATAGAPCGGRH